MKTKEYLLKRQQELHDALEEYNDILAELKEVEQALAALEPRKCSGCADGCDICRRGWYYR